MTITLRVLGPQGFGWRYLGEFTSVDDARTSAVRWRRRGRGVRFQVGVPRGRSRVYTDLDLPDPVERSGPSAS